uniref:Uncharacterized protein n=1 Tax=uncultured marine virus TaxID=186617 RepID=A0A0F7L4Q3_9VIRU|nr:hypothetical protein [uncultured marine virus]
MTSQTSGDTSRKVTFAPSESKDIYLPAPPPLIISVPFGSILKVCDASLTNVISVPT